MGVDSEISEFSISLALGTAPLWCDGQTDTWDTRESVGHSGETQLRFWVISGKPEGLQFIWRENLECSNCQLNTATVTDQQSEI